MSTKKKVAETATKVTEPEIKPAETETKPFNADEFPFDSPDLVEVVKKPVVQKAVQMGEQKGAPGDYLMIASVDDRYPVPKDFFDNNYQSAQIASDEKNQLESELTAIINKLKDEVADQTEKREAAEALVVGKNIFIEKMEDKIAIIIGEKESLSAQIAEMQIEGEPDGVTQVVMDAADGAAGRILKAGTVFQIAGVEMKLMLDTVVDYPDATNEQKFVGICAQSANLEVNKPNFKFRYNAFGTREPLFDQVDDPHEIEPFIAALTEEEAASFGVSAEHGELTKVHSS